MIPFILILGFESRFETFPSADRGIWAPAASSGQYMGFSTSDSFPSHRRTLSAFWTILQLWSCWKFHFALQLCPGLSACQKMSLHYAALLQFSASHCLALDKDLLCLGKIFLSSISSGCCLSLSEICHLGGLSQLSCPPPGLWAAAVMHLERAADTPKRCLLAPLFRPMPSANSSHSVRVLRTSWEISRGPPAPPQPLAHWLQTLSEGLWERTGWWVIAHCDWGSFLGILSPYSSPCLIKVVLKVWFFSFYPLP